MLANQLSPKEKRRLDRFIQDLKRGPIDFIARQKVRIILTILGADRPGNRVLQADAIEILRDEGSFKERRLRELING